MTEIAKPHAWLRPVVRRACERLFVQQANALGIAIAIFLLAPAFIASGGKRGG